ncbi:DUF4262 domain-containing protein [Pedosphaera parvula]|uniref:DUF4262 domain-containing protein n=1 Tax=Pedosphaera parvula (strain Ellin514) TaxID=320771 RepID=B9XNL3_PEDPL|nr:DUF4262 domain-containing protein [Pedosphaera parvula]EEF58553.1 conserved hypothetical protein [Pedosphaera parvula Ellin514]
MLPNFKWPKPEDARDDKLIRDIINHKCQIISIPEDKHGPAYSFSVGLYLHFMHPEIVIFSLQPKTAAITINNICRLIQQGRRFQHGDTVHDLFDTVDVAMIDVDRRCYGYFLGTALWFYRSINEEFPTLQLVWPDKHGNLPWDETVNPQVKQMQPLLGTFRHP